MKTETRIVFDPYRKKYTTILQFAKDEGVPKYTADHFYRYHNTLERFRDRPKKGSNGLSAHTYTYGGRFIDMTTARKMAKCSMSLLSSYHKRGITDLETIIKDRQTPYYVKNARKFETDDGRIMSVSDFAKENGEFRNSVACFAKVHRTLKGYFNRGPSRIRPKKFPDTSKGIALTAREWAKKYHVSPYEIKYYVHSHLGKMDGFATRLQKPRLIIKYKGKPHTVRDLANVFNVPPWKIRNYFNQHKTMKGFDPARTIGKPKNRSKSKAVA